jgi:hypothetical protein
MFPSKAARKEHKDTPEHRAWERIYPTAALQEKNPFTQEFVNKYNQKKPLYRLVMQYVIDTAAKVDFRPKVDPTDAKSQVRIHISHYTPIIARTSARCYYVALGVLAADPKSLYKQESSGIKWEQYDFSKDPYKALKNKDFMKNMKTIWETAANKGTYLSPETVVTTLMDEITNVKGMALGEGQTDIAKVRGATDEKAKEVNEARAAEALLKTKPVRDFRREYDATNTWLFNNRGADIRFQPVADHDYEYTPEYIASVARGQPRTYPDMADRFRGNFPLKKRVAMAREGEAETEGGEAA